MQDNDNNNLSSEQDLQTTDNGSESEGQNNVSHIEEQEQIENVEASEQPSEEKQTKEEIPVWVKEKLGKEKKRHSKELRALKEQIAAMQSMLGGNQTSNDVQNTQMRDPYTGNEIKPGSVQEEVYKALQSALLANKQQEAKQKELEKLAVVKQSYNRLQEEMENASEVYEDFDDIVRDDNAPFTPAMRDTAALLSNPVDVLYKLGKNRNELNRIASLHPIQQAQEMIRLSFDLMGQKKNTSSAPKPITPLKNNPAISSTARITEKSSVSEIRKYLKSRK